MPRSIQLLLVQLLVTLALPARAQVPPDSLAARVDALFAPWDRPDVPGAAVAVMKDGEIVYQRGYGSANLEYDIPITSSM